MKSEIIEENKILRNKKHLIANEINIKKESLGNIEIKRKELLKKPGYNVEKETTEKIYEVLTRDIKSYEESIEEPYFGRIDFREYRSLPESLYIGKKGITNSKDCEEIVIDWRAPVADLYYSGTGGEASYKAPGGIIEGELSLKRKFIFRDGTIKEIFDEGINELMINGEEGQELVDEFLKVNLEESRGKKLKEVVATIQKEQNDIIRWPKNLPIIVQGSAGSGKTTIALHRLAYLIYRYKEAMSGEDILVLAPNKLFLDYISDTLPSLGANEVKQQTFEELVLEKLKIKSKIFNKDEKLKSILEEESLEKRKLISNASKVKGTLIYKMMLDRYIALVEHNDVEFKDITVEGRVLFSKREILRLYRNDLKNYPINKRKNEIKRYLNLKIKDKIKKVLQEVDEEWDLKIHEIKRKQEDSPERRELLIKEYEARDTLKNSISKNAKKDFNNFFKSWKDIKSKDLYYNFFNDKELFRMATDNKIPDILEEFIRDEYNKNHDNKIIDEDDLAALLYIKILIDGLDEGEKFQHIVVDEAQDYSPFQVYLVNKLAKGNSITLVGDLAQGIYYYKGVNRWEDITEGLFKGEATYIQLTQSYRSTVEIIDFAEKALLAQNLGLKSAKPVLRHGEKPKIIEINKESIVIEIDRIIEEVHKKEKNTIAIITKNIKEAEDIYKMLKSKSKYSIGIVRGKESEVEEEIIVLPSYITKGLEFDCTIIINTNNYEENLLDERLLYVSLTRALHFEYILSITGISSLIKNN